MKFAYKYATLIFGLTASLALCQTAYAEPTVDKKITELTARLAELEKQQSAIVEQSNKEILDLTRRLEEEEHKLKGLSSVKPIIVIGQPELKAELESQAKRQLTEGGVQIKSDAPATLLIKVGSSALINVTAQLKEAATLKRPPQQSFMATSWELSQETYAPDQEKNFRSTKYRKAQQQLMSRVVAEFIQQYKNSNRKM